MEKIIELLNEAMETKEKWMARYERSPKQSAAHAIATENASYWRGRVNALLEVVEILREIEGE